MRIVVLHIQMMTLKVKELHPAQVVINVILILVHHIVVIVIQKRRMNNDYITIFNRYNDSTIYFMAYNSINYKKNQ